MNTRLMKIAMELHKEAIVPIVVPGSTAISAGSQGAQATLQLARTGGEMIAQVIPLMFMIAATGGGLTGYMVERATSPSADSQKNLQKEIVSWKQQDALQRGQEEFAEQEQQAAQKLAQPKRGMMWR